MGLEVTKITCFKSKNPGKRLANGEVTFNACLSVAYTLFEGAKGQFVSWPCDIVEKDGKKNYYPKVKLLDDDMRKHVEAMVLEEYQHPTFKDEKKTESKKTNTSMDDDIPF